MAMQQFTGCSGFHYREWKERFYPAGLPQRRWLEYYASQFDTLELNNTFYRFPTEKSLAKWYTDTPPEFSFVVKATKLFTHFKRMKDVRAELDDFYAVTATALREKLRCYLFQFPASVRYSDALLDSILSQCTSELLHTFEFRHLSWWEPAVVERLQAAGHVFCNISLPDFPDLFVPDSRCSYLRFHGKPELYKTAYGPAGLDWWIRELKARPSDTVFALFNNTWYGSAVDDARIFRAAIAGG